MALRLMSLFGLVCLVFLAWLLSENRAKVNWRLIAYAIGLQFAIGLLLLPGPFNTYVIQPACGGAVYVLTAGHYTLHRGLDELLFAGVDKAIALLTHSSQEGARFVFGVLVDDKDIKAMFAFQVLPIIVFVSAISTVLYHLGVIQFFVRILAWCMRRTMKTSGAETFGTALLVFTGIESLNAIRAYVREMTRSEINTVMTAFMATIAGSVMVVYASFGARPGHLLVASLMSAPAAILMAKLLTPETDKPKTDGTGKLDLPRETHNLLDAAARGTSDGLQMALQVGAMVIVFLGLVYLINAGLGAASRPILALCHAPMEVLTLKDILSFFFMPFAFVMGVPFQDVPDVAALLGTKTVLNEFLAYLDLKKVADGMSPRSVMIATYALCGFANPGSLAIVIAGMTGIAPERRKEIVELGWKCFAGGTLACFVTACVAGVLCYD